MSQSVEGRVCAWGDFPGEPPHELCDREGVRESGYSTQEGGSVQGFLCEQHYNELHGDSADSATSI